jgi:hypothetical protein
VRGNEIGKLPQDKIEGLQATPEGCGMREQAETTGKAKTSWIVPIIIVTCPFWLGAILFLVAYLRAIDYVEGHAESYRELKGRPELALLVSLLPETATDISYFVTPAPLRSHLQTEFQTTEEDFLLWARTKGWGVREADPRGDHIQYPISPDEPLPQSGYYYSQTSPDGELITVTEVMFDRDRQRAYYYFTIYKRPPG